MKVGITNIDRTVELTEEESIWLEDLAGLNSLLCIDNENQWSLVKDLLVEKAEQMIGSNQLETGIGFASLRSLLFKLHGWKLDEWEKAVRLNAHPPTGKLLALWTLPPEQIEKMLNR